MSHTDKDMPYWVRAQSEGTLDHEFWNGHKGCIVQQGRPVHHYSHYSRCKKRVEVAYTCTATEPDSTRWYMPVERKCWSTWFDFDAMTRRWNKCLGHTKIEVDDSIPCSCDDFEPAPTCGYDLDWHAKHINAEKGEGDRIEWNTPRTRILATRRMERQVMAAEWREYLDSPEYAAKHVRGACGVCGEVNNPDCILGC